MTPLGNGDSRFESYLNSLDRHGFDASGLVALDVTDNFGQRTVIRLSKLDRNPKLGPDLFRFTPPAGADVVTE